MKFVNLLRVMEFVEWWSWREKSGGSGRIEKGIVACLCKFNESDEGNVV